MFHYPDSSESIRCPDLPVNDGGFYFILFYLAASILQLFAWPAGMKLGYLCLWVAAAVIYAAHHSYALQPHKLQALINFATQNLRLDKHEFEDELRITLYAASKLRGAPCIVEDVFISKSLVLKICFPDGDCWAAKWGSEDKFEEIFAGINALGHVERYCPHIPVSKMRGWNMGNHLVTVFTE